MPQNRTHPGPAATRGVDRRAVELAKNDYRLLRDLVRVRESKGLSQKDVADMLGISQQAISKFERLDADPRLSTIRQYAFAVGALVAHAVDVDESVEAETSWRIVKFTLPQPSTDSAKARSYHVPAPAKMDYAVAA